MCVCVCVRACVCATQGEALRQEQCQAAREQYNRWQRKILWDSVVPRVNGQLPEFTCHLRRGSGKFEEILKDKPQKYSLRKPGMALKVKDVWATILFMCNHPD